MALMSRKVDYALLILSYLHERPEGGCAREVAAHFGLSRAFVANILKELCQNGFVSSHRGVKGGYALQHSAEDYNLAELMQALDGAFQFAECSPEQGDRLCCFKPMCPVKDQIQEVHRRVYDVLRGVTLAELFRSGRTAYGLQVVRN
jgi:Rrf2 family protein